MEHACAPWHFAQMGNRKYRIWMHNSLSGVTGVHAIRNSFNARLQDTP